MSNVAARPPVLIVEDETFVRFVAADILADAGYQPLEAADAQEALAVLEARPDIALMFTDINMPGDMDGLALARRVTNERPKLALVVTSGKQRILDKDLPDHGVFLAKPYRPAELVQLIETQLQRTG